MDISLKHLKDLLTTLGEGGASEFEYQDEKFRVRVSMAGAAPVTAAPVRPGAAGALPAAPAAAPEATPQPEADPKVVFVTSPFVGTFYRAPAPGAEPFVREGANVKPGQTLCIVEAMKLMNEIEAEYPCTILEILVENGVSVEFGQKLFQVRKT